MGIPFSKRNGIGLGILFNGYLFMSDFWEI